MPMGNVQRFRAGPSRGPRSPSLAVACCALVTLACGDPAARPTGRLWYAGRALCGVSAPQLEGGGDVRPEIILTAAPLTSLSDVAFDREGNAWIVGVGSSEIRRIPAPGLTRSGAAVADLVIASTALDHPRNLAFDGNGSLWVVNRGAAPDGSDAPEGTLLRFDGLHGLSGAQTVAPSLRMAGTGLPTDPLYLAGSLAFDASGNLWVTSYAGIVRFDDPRSLAGEVAPSPSAIVEKWNELVYFYSIAFDTAGALWAVAITDFFHLSSVIKFSDPGALLGASVVERAVTIAGPPDALPAGGLAFDEHGDLWLATNDAIYRYAEPDRLLGEVDPQPAVTLRVVNEASPMLNAHLVLFPAPAGFPVH